MVNNNSFVFLTFLIFFSSFFPKNTSAQNSSTGSMSHSATFELVHKSNSKYSGGDRDEPSMDDIISSNQGRVNAIHDSESKNTSLPAFSGLPLVRINEYIVSIGLGTPAQNVTFEIDTGSVLSWTQCQPCAACHRQKGHVYKPSSSRNISCHSRRCSMLGYHQNRSIGPCRFSFKYSDDSYTAGFLLMDTLELTPTADVFPNFVFGCAQNVSGSFGEEGGLLGLGRSNATGVSIVDQTSQIYKQYFSYCFPSNQSFKGHLTFGKNSANTKKLINFTPLIPHPVYYSIRLLQISVAGNKLPISPSVFKASRCIIDSGTSLTYLPPAAYKELRASFKKAMNKMYPSVPTPYPVLDTCFDVYHNNSISTPKISISFGGNATVELDSSGILRRIINSTIVCLAFVANDVPTDLTVLGNNLQRRMEVVYDVGGQRLGLLSEACK